MAHKNHPDKGGIKHRYQAIQHAYDVLGNPVSRKHYDETGETEEKKKSPVEDILLGLFSELVAKCQERDFNFIKLGKKLVKDKIKQAKANIATSKAQSEKLSQVSGRVKTDSEFNYFDMILESKISALEHSTETHAEALQNLNMALKYLDSCTDEFVAEPPKVSTFSQEQMIQITRKIYTGTTST